MIDGKRYLQTAKIEFATSKKRPEWQYWVSVCAPADSRMLIESGCFFEYEDIIVEFVRKIDGLLSEVVASCRTSAELVPSLVPSTSPGSKFKLTEAPDDSGDLLISTLCRLEAFLAPFGLLGFDFRRLQWSWFSKDKNGKETVIFSRKMDFEENKIRRLPLQPRELKNLGVEALGAGKQELLTLSLFRAGEDSFQNYRYQDALRYFLLAIEHEFAGGAFHNRDVKKNLSKEKRLISAIEQADKYVRYFVIAGDIDKNTVQDLLSAQKPSAIIQWIISMRGYLFHQSVKRKENWHPSLHISHKKEAIIVRSILETVIAEIIFGAKQT